MGDFDPDDIAKEMSHNKAPSTQKMIEHYKLERLANVDPVKLLHVLEDHDRMADRVEQLERNQKITNAVDGRKDSIEIGTPGKGGYFKHYYDPSAPAMENDRLMAEQARVFMNGGGELPERFSKRIKDYAIKIEADAAEAAKKPQEA